MYSNQIDYNEDEPFHEFKELQRDALKAGRSHFRNQLQNIASYRNNHGDFSDPTDSEAKDSLASNGGKIDFMTENRPFKRNHPITFDKSDYEALSRINVHIFGFRIIPEYIKGQVAVRVKPKIRYATLRHSLEMTLHMWSVDYTNDEDAMCAVGPNGSSF